MKTIQCEESALILLRSFLHVAHLAIRRISAEEWPPEKAFQAFRSDVSRLMNSTGNSSPEVLRNLQRLNVAIESDPMAAIALLSSGAMKMVDNFLKFDPPAVTTPDTAVQ